MSEVKAVSAVKILLVDDEENILRSLTRLLVNEDFEVVTSTSGEEALKILSSEDNIGLIISDQRMPGLTGVDFLERAREISEDLPKILLTGYSDVKAAVDAINRGGAYRYITKPWKDDELVQTVKEAVQRYELQKENKELTAVIEKQNEELQSWNDQLQYHVQEQMVEIQNKNKELEDINDRLRRNFKNTIHAFSNLIELRDKNSVSHSRNVADLSIMVARDLELKKRDIESIMVAALLHDIGKIGMPDVLLTKSLNEMSPEEQNIYRQYPVRGQVAIDHIEDLRSAGVLIRHHQERFDGTGFPDGLKGDEIPVGSRIIAIAEFIDGNIQSFRGDNAIEFSMKKLRDEIGKRFDNKLISLIDRHASTLYARKSSGTGVVEMELSVRDLRPGMVVSRDVYSGTGLLMLKKGSGLNLKNINALKRAFTLDPAKSSIFVWIND